MHLNQHLHTMVPLLGPIGGGLDLSSSVYVAPAAGGAAASSAAFTTNREFLVFLEGNVTIAELIVIVSKFPGFDFTTNPEVADAMLQNAISLQM